MHNCKSCNYHINKLSSFKKHLTTKKHLLLNSNINKEVLICSKCNKKYKTNNGFNGHLMKCNNIKNEIELLKNELEILKLKIILVPSILS